MRNKFHNFIENFNMQLSHKQILQNIMVIAIGKRKEIDFHEK